MKYIFLPTIQHTGTWFIIDLLRQHSSIKDFVELKDLRPFSEIGIIHTHFGDGETIAKDDICKHIPFYVIKDIIGDSPVIIPIRDPLLSLITRQLRHPDLQHSYIIEGFVSIAGLSEAENIFFVPIDIYKNKPYEERLQLLRSMFNSLGLQEEPFLKLWAASWPLRNSVGAVSQEYYEYYTNNNIAALDKVIPEEIAHLKSKEQILRPFLEQLGYRKLIWWS